MNGTRAGCVVLVLLLVTGVVGSAAAEGVAKLRVDGLKNNILSLTVRGVKECKDPVTRVGGREASLVPGSKKSDPTDGSHFFQVELPCDVKPGKVALEVKVGDEILKTEPYLDIPNPLLMAGSQPLIEEVQPAGGLPSATITIVGQNFGDDLSKVFITVGRVNTCIFPVSISKPDSQAKQRLVFALPPSPPEDKWKAVRETDPFLQILDGHSIRSHALLTVTVSDRPSNCAHLNVVHPHGLYKVAALSVGLLVILLTPFLAVCCWLIALGGIVVLAAYLCFALRSDSCWIFSVVFAVLALAALGLARYRLDKLEPIVRTLFIEKDTNTYSLSRVQAFAWTVVIIGTYVYYAVGFGILVGTAKIPDINEGLLGLLTISYTGLIASHGISKSRPKNELTPDPARWTNLITEGNTISITRLQLIGFSIAGIAVYVFYISGSDLFFKGMPDIPTTLNGLMAVSQGGYLGGKFVGDTAVNYVIPKYAKASGLIHIFGVGFQDQTRVLIKGVPDPVKTERLNANCLKVQLPADMGDLEVKPLVLVPPTGASSVVNEAFQLIEPRIVNLRFTDREVSFTLEGVELGKDELRARIDERPLQVMMQEAKTITLKSDFDLTANMTLSLKTAEGNDLVSQSL